MSEMQGLMCDIAEKYKADVEYDRTKGNVYVRAAWDKGKFIDCHNMTANQIKDLVINEIQQQLTTTTLGNKALKER